MTPSALRAGCRHGMLLLLCCLLTLTSSAVLFAQNVPAHAAGKPLYEPGVVLVSFRARASSGARVQTARRLSLTAESASAGGWVKMRVGPGTAGASARILGAASTADDVQAAVEALRRDPEVRVAEPNYYRYPSEAPRLPNDHSFGEQSGLHNVGQLGGTPDADIDAPDVWAKYTGDPAVIVAVIDTGVDYTHDDLRANILRHADGSVFGYDFADNDPDPMDVDGHGTHCAGIIGAVAGNGAGIAGVCPNVKIMPLRFMKPQPDGGASGTIADAIRAIDWARVNGAQVINASYGYSGFSQLELEAIQRARDAGIVFCAAAGNSGSNNDIQPNNPAGYNSQSDNVISVAASDATDNLAAFSNFGPRTVDVAAPGVSVYSTLPGNNYGYMSGTSMAAPHVAGAAALLKGAWKTRSLAASSYKAALCGQVDRPATLAGKLISGGRLNVLFAYDGRSTWSISGRVVNASGAGVGGVTVTAAASGAATAADQTAADGSYTLSGLDSDFSTYAVEPTPLNGLSAPRQSVTVGADRKDRLGVVFTLQAGATAPAPAQVEHIVDNASTTGVTRSGTWSASRNAAGFFGTDYLHDGNSGKGGKGVRFTPNLPSAGTYEVSLWYPDNPNGAVNIPVEVRHAGGSATKTLSQKTGGGRWVVLGTYAFEAGTGGYVTVRNAGTTGYVIADAVRFRSVDGGATPVPSPPPPAPALSGLSVSPASVVGGSTPHPAGAVTLSAPAPAGGAVVALSSSAPGAAAVPSSVTVPEGQTGASFVVTTGPVAAATSVTVTASFGDVSKTASLTVTPPGSPSPTEVIVDNGQAIRTGTWTASTGLSGRYGSNYLHDGRSGKGSKSVTYAPNLPSSGTYQVYVWYPNNPNGATNVPIDVRHAGGTARVAIPSQRSGGGRWVALGAWSFEAGTGGSVTVLNAGTTGYVVADAVRFVK